MIADLKLFKSIVFVCALLLSEWMVAELHVIPDKEDPNWLGGNPNFLATEGSDFWLTFMNVKVFDALKQALIPYRPEIADIKPIYGPERAGDIPHSIASIEKISALLGYKPNMMFADGIRQTAEWYFRQSE